MLLVGSCRRCGLDVEVREFVNAAFVTTFLHDDLHGHPHTNPQPTLSVILLAETAIEPPGFLGW